MAVERAYNQPIKEPANHHQGTVDACNRLPLVSMQIVAKISHVSKRDPFHNEKFPIGFAEPSSKLPKIVLDCSTGVDREIIGSEVARHERWFLGSDKQTLKNIIVPIAALFWTGIGHHIDASSLGLDR